MNRARDAHTLARRLTARTGADVEVRWHPSTGSKRRQWHVIWSDGPSPATMSELVQHMSQDLRDLAPTALAYHRIISPRTIALSLIRNTRRGQPPLGVRQLAQQLRHTDYPDRGGPDDTALADTLLRLSQYREARMPAVLTRYGLTGLGAQPNTPDNVVPIRRRRNT